MHVPLVEDDLALAHAIHDGLRRQGRGVTHAPSAHDGSAALALNAYDACILDVGLPDGSGLEVCRGMRAGGNTTPVLLPTARDTVDDRVMGLDSGGDDYLVKPFAFAELVARVRALARRAASLLPGHVRVADLEVELRSHTVRRAGRPIELTGKEWTLLEFFIRNTGAVVERAAITAYVWDDKHDPAGNALEVLVRRLRAKIDDDFEPRIIQTVRGAGYRFGTRRARTLHHPSPAHRVVRRGLRHHPARPRHAGRPAVHARTHGLPAAVARRRRRGGRSAGPGQRCRSGAAASRRTTPRGCRRAYARQS